MDNYNNQQQRDIILSPNEFVFVQSNTNGIIKTYTGPITITISTQDTLVIFDDSDKIFKPVQNPQEAKQLMIIPPENWYAILKNPTKNNQYPEAGKASVAPELSYGRKVNIKGPSAFALYPGQMAKVVCGHALRSNQYLLARVYEAESANSNDGEILDADGNKIRSSQKYVNGQLLVIKGTEVSFYIPPTGIEVIPVENNRYVREAITLERLEYCILKDEDGNKRYVHGPEVVFPEPTETFVSSRNGGYVFRAMELSKISGIYVKVIAEYTENDITHPIGEELFITGNEQMIYYPRPEHSIISYDGKIIHHAIAIPKGEGRYVLNRLTGEINTVIGPCMYLPDPRTEVIVKRKLTPQQCKLWYPGNNEVLQYNIELDEKSIEKSLKQITKNINVFDVKASSADNLSFYNETSPITINDIESNASISRGTSYTKPRTITLDNKYDGAVSIKVWPGYAVCVVSENGERRIVKGPNNILLNYDETLEVIEDGCGDVSVYLNLKDTNLMVSIPTLKTSDGVSVNMNILYDYEFSDEKISNWFDIMDCYSQAKKTIINLVKEDVATRSLKELSNNYIGYIKEALEGVELSNGLSIINANAYAPEIKDKNIAELLYDFQKENVIRDFEVSSLKDKVELVEKQLELQKKQYELNMAKRLDDLELERKEKEKQMDMNEAFNRRKEAEEIASKTAEKDLNVLLDAIQESKLARERKEQEARLSVLNAEAALDKAKQEAYAATVSKIFSSIGPDLTAALNAKTNAEILNNIGDSIAPYAMANGESVADFVQKLLKGTSLESLLENFSNNQ